MLDYLTLDDVPMHGYVGAAGARDVTRVEGLIGLPQVKGGSTERAEAHGVRFNPGKHLGGKLITWEGEAWGDTIDDAFTEFDAVSKALYRTLSDGPKLLKWGTARGLELQRRVRFVGPVEPPLEEGAALLRYQVQVEADDPRAYSQTLNTFVGSDVSGGAGGLLFPLAFPFAFTQSAGGAVNVANGGTVETPVIVRAYGPVTSPIIVLASTGQQVKIEGTIAAGEFLEIDSRNRTVKLNGAALRMNMLDTINSEFFDLPPGPHTVRMIAQTFGAGAHPEVDARDAYGG